MTWNVVDEALEREPGAYPILRGPAGDEPAARGSGAGSDRTPEWQPRGPSIGAEFGGLSAAPGGVVWSTVNVPDAGAVCQ